ncbi:MAG: hypothetical protein IJN25_09645 [Clostridia bacterium]|nr:hypothetical protein [Clostridia bacterium]
MNFDIAKIDKNLVPNGDTKREDAVFYSLREEPFRLYGLYNAREERPFRRMPAEYTERVGEGYTLMMGMTAGARARFKTDSSYIILRAETPKVTPYTACGTITAMKGFDLYFIDEKGEERYYKSFRPPVQFEKGYEAILEMPEGMHEMVLYFPMYNQISDVYLGFQKTATLGGGRRYAIEKPILFYGSSITQGCCTGRTGNIYSSVVGRMLDCDTVNLGVSGGAKGQLPTAEYISGLSLSAFVYDYDYNAPDLAFLQETYMPFLRIIREKQPKLPIVLVSMISRVFPELEERKAFIRAQYEAMRAAGDENVYFIDGQSLISDTEWDMTTTDTTHPNDFGFLRMAEGMIPVLRGILEGKKNGI